MASEELKKAISDTVRQTVAEVSFDLTDVSAKEDCTPTFPNQAPFSNAGQILNGNPNKDIKIATLEKGFWKLDGSFMNLGYKDISNNEIGFISDAISKDDCTFNETPIIVFNFTETHSSIGLTLFFDNLTNNYCKKIRVKFYNGSTILSDEIVTIKNVQFAYGKRVENYNKIEIEFLETSKPHRRVRFLEIFFGIIQTYKDKEIVNCNLTREFNPLNDNIPSHELTLEIDNLAKEFNLINPQGLYNFLQKRQEVSVKMGVILNDGTPEYINMGSYYLNDWSTKEMIATLKAKDVLSFLEKVFYSNATSQTKTLKDFVIEILTFAGVKNYVLDDSLDNISVTTAIPNTSVKELLKQIAIANNCVLFVDKNNQINIVKLASIVTNSITLDNMYKVPEISLDEVVTKVNVTYGNDITLSVVSSEIDGKEISVSSIFIPNESQAQIVAEYLLALYQNRLKYKIDWRQNIDIDINNKNTVEDDFNENREVIITKQEFKYAGYLSGHTEGRGVQL